MTSLVGIVDGDQVFITIKTLCFSKMAGTWVPNHSGWNGEIGR